MRNMIVTDEMQKNIISNMSISKKIIIFLVFVSMAFSGFAEEVADRFQEANYFIQGKDYDKAILEYEAVLKIEPRQPIAHLQLGLLYALKKDYIKSIESYKEVLSINVNSFLANYNLALVYTDKEDFIRAISYFKRARKINPKSASVHYNLALVYSGQGEYNDSVESFKETIKLNPSNFDAYVGLGGVYYNLGQKSLALKQAQKLNSLGKFDYANALSNWIKEKERAEGILRY